MTPPRFLLIAGVMDHTTDGHWQCSTLHARHTHDIIRRACNAPLPTSKHSTSLFQYLYSFPYCAADLDIVSEMQFVKTLIYLATLLGFVMAQSMQILSPPAGTSLTPGNNFTVALQMSNFPENIDIVAVVIGLQSCATACSLYEYMGSVLYQGSFAPSGVLAANFSVAVPSSFSSGAAILGVDTLYMIGAEYQPDLQYVNQNVTVS